MLNRVTLAGAALLVGAAFPLTLAAQRAATARDSTLERQARLIARLDSQVTALRREVRARAADSTHARGARPAPDRAPTPLDVGGLLQLWYAQGDGGFQSTFRVRRAELRLSGDAGTRARWVLTADAAKALTTSSTTDVNGGGVVVTGTAVNQSGRILQDAFVVVALPAGHELHAGQFKLPLGLEGGGQSSSALETVERAMFTSDRARGGSYGDARDAGALLRSPDDRAVEYALGVFNGVGESQNDTDRDGMKVVVARLGTTLALLRGLGVGASGAWSTRGGPDTLARRRVGADAKLIVGPVTVKGEYMAGRDGVRRGEGWYAHLGYSPTARLNLIARHDVFDPDRARESTPLDARERDWIAGFSYAIPATSARLQMNYLRKLLPPAIAPARGLLLTNLQVAW